MKKSSYLLFTDGACSGNPGIGAWAFVGIKLASNLGESLVHEEADIAPLTTNNRMELSAILKAIEWLGKKDFEQAAIWTDSKYVQEGLSRWMYGWQRNNWVTKEGKAVSNQDLWQEALALEKSLAGIWKKIRLEKLPGHHGILGNERCDQLAREAIEKTYASTYEGDLKNHPFGMDMLKTSPEKPTEDLGKFWYISLVAGEAKRHKTWPECEAFVRGKGGAKFKKVFSIQEESLILKGWGGNPIS